MSEFNITLAQEFVESTDPFPVDFDLAWQWMGFATKASAKRVLSQFEKGVDYSTRMLKNPSAGRPSELIFLSIDAFKSMGMMAGTEQGKAIRRYFLDCEKIAKQKDRNPLGAYAERVKLMYDNSQIPQGYWSILHESAFILLWVETVLKCPIDKTDLLDGSIGIRWSQYRKGKDWAGDRINYIYTFPDGRQVDPWCYRMEELHHFRYFMEEYKQEYLIDYLRSKGYTQLLIKQAHEVRAFVGESKAIKESYQMKLFG